VKFLSFGILVLGALSATANHDERGAHQIIGGEFLLDNWPTTVQRFREFNQEL
jgi:hypothetical protein